MNPMFIATLLCLGALVAGHGHDGSYHGEGEAESQDFGQYDNHYVAYAAPYGGVYPGVYNAHDDGSYHGEGEAESHDVGQYNGHYLAASPYGGVYAVGNDDGQYKGEGLAESQDYGQYDAHHVAYAGHYGAAYAYGAAPLAHDGHVVDTPEVAHAKAAHYAAHAAASHGAYAAPAHAYIAAPAHAYVAAPAHAYVAAPYARLAYAHGYAHGAAPIGHDGRVVDTPEVAHAKAAHYAAHAAASHHY